MDTGNHHQIDKTTGFSRHAMFQEKAQAVGG